MQMPIIIKMNSSIVYPLVSPNIKLAFPILRLKLPEALVLIHALPDDPAQARFSAGASAMPASGDVSIVVTHIKFSSE